MNWSKHILRLLTPWFRSLIAGMPQNEELRRAKKLETAGTELAFPILDIKRGSRIQRVCESRTTVSSLDGRLTIRSQPLSEVLQSSLLHLISKNAVGGVARE